MTDKKRIIEKLTKELVNSLERNKNLREIIDEVLNNGYEITILKPSPNKDISIEIKKRSRSNFNLTHDDQVFLKSIKIKTDD